MRKNRTLYLLILWILILFSSCQQEETDITGPKENPNNLHYKFTRGGAPIEVIVRLSANDLDLTEYLRVQIETLFEEGIHVTPLFLSETIYNPLLLIENPVKETFWSEEQALMVNRWTYRFEPIESGEFTFQAFSVNFRLDKEKSDDPSKWPVHQIETDPIKYLVRSVELGELDDIKGIKGFLLPPFNFIPLLVVLVFLSGIAIIFVVYFKYVKKQSVQTTELMPVIDYYKDAVRQLDNLENGDLLEREEFEPYHTRLSEILRDYLEHYFGLKAKEQTTEEFITEIFDTRKFTTEQRGILNRFLQLADLVKFASFQPERQISSEALQKVRQFVQNTGTDHEV
jgi:hypothetical protein